MIAAMRQHAPFTIILLLYLAVGALYAIYTPDWQTPDEPAHYNYVRQLADGRFPIMQPGDYDQEFIMDVVFAGPPFPPEVSLEPMSYEDWQPPLYYFCLLYTSPSPRDRTRSRMPSSA